MRFTDIPAHPTLKKRLLSMAHSGHVPHAQLFWGPTGNAALPMALAFITYLNCQHPLPADACGKCKSCLQLNKLTHPDVKFTFPISTTKTNSGATSASNSLLPSWRSFIQEQPYGDLMAWSSYIGIEHKQLLISKEEITLIRQYMQLKPFESTYKFNLIWLPEYMHPTAAHALLKSLEEPPTTHTIFLLVSTAPERLFSTIRSRLQQMYIPAFTDEALAQLIGDNHQLPPDELTALIRLAAGNANKAYQLLANNQLGLFENFVSWMRLCYTQDFAKLMAEVERFQEIQKEGQKYFLTYSLHMLRQIWIAHLSIESLLQVQKEEKQFTEKLGQTLNEDSIAQIQQWFNQAHYHIDRNLNAKILFLNLSLKIAQVFQAIRQRKE